MPYRSLLLLLMVVRLSAAGVDATTFAPSIKVPSAQRPVDLTHYFLTVRVRGLYAECMASMTFHNSNGVQLDGTLEFPLPDHASVSGYALDINNRMVDGVVVGKDQARIVLEAERRQRVDPGLVELVRGNLFRTRIWPIPAMGQRTVMVTWIQDLALRGDDAALRIALPRTALQCLKLHLEIASGSVEPQIGGFGNLNLTSWKDMRVADATLIDVTPGDDLLVRLPAIPRQLIQVEESDNERFVAISERAQLPPNAASAPPSRLAVAWDASGSRTPEAIAKARTFLQTLLQRCPACLVDLVVFRDVPEPTRTFTDAGQLLTAIDHLAYDGGTALSRLDLTRTALPHPNDRCWVLVSDGLGTIGQGLPANGDVPVFCAVADIERDDGFLHLIAARTGGAVINLISSTADAAVTACIDPPARLLRVESNPNVLGDVQSSFTEGRATVLARLVGDGAIDLVYGSAGKETARSHIQITTPGHVSGGVLARAWAGARAIDLGVFPELNRAELIALGQRYHLVTPGTSLIVLERLDQYVRHQITPPGTQPDLRDAYFSWQKSHATNRQTSDQGHLNQVLSWWQMRVNWWQRQPEKPPIDGVMPPTPLAESTQQSMFGSRASGGSSAARPAAASTTPVTTSSDTTVEELASSEEAEQDNSKSAGPAAQMQMEAALTAAWGSLGGHRHMKQAGQESAGVITITPFDPNMPYLRSLKDAAPEQTYATYLRERDTWRTSPSFFLDCAGFFFARDAALGHRVLSNLAELRIDDPALLRVYAWRLEEAGDRDGAVDILRHVLRLRPEEPQSYRDLALALSARGEANGHGADISEAMALLYRVVMRQPLEDVYLGVRSEFNQAWDRFPQIEVVALEELNRLLAVAEHRIFDAATQAPPLDPRLIRLMDCDLRVVMSWNADGTDIDLHVVEPNGEEAYYGHNQTANGGMVSADMTTGYGPEEYLMHHASHGSYRIRCHYYGTTAVTLLGPTTVTAMAITNWGRPTEKRRMLTLRLSERGEFESIGEIAIDSSPGDGSHTAAGASSTVTIEQLKALTIGQHRAEVEAKLGLPLRVDGDGLMILVYKTSTGALSRLGFGPDLMWAREILDGAERDLLAH